MLWMTVQDLLLFVLKCENCNSNPLVQTSLVSEIIIQYFGVTCLLNIERS